MIIEIYNKKYKINTTLAASAKRAIRNILKKARIEAELRGMADYYTVFVIMMYTVSSSILSELNTDNIKNILEEIENAHSTPEENKH